ncbi:hypothetical protein KAW80_03000 [Candidatus Babeliales bacterium]|nr:hypothetical protein [Candidatus Babeliales bacterium]
MKITIMNKNYRSLLLVLCLSCGLVVRPISENTADLLSIGTMACAVAGTSLAMETNFSDNFSVWPIVVGAGTFFLARTFLQQFTPEGKYKRAVKKLTYIKNHSLLQADLNSHLRIDEHFNNLYGGDWYLVRGKEDLDYLKDQANNAAGLLTDLEYLGWSGTRPLRGAAESLRSDISYLSTLLMRDKAEYDRQYNRYQRHLENIREDRRHYEDIRERKEDRRERRQEHKELVSTLGQKPSTTIINNNIAPAVIPAAPVKHQSLGVKKDEKPAKAPTFSSEVEKMCDEINPFNNTQAIKGAVDNFKKEQKDIADFISQMADDTTK